MGVPALCHLTVAENNEVRHQQPNGEQQYQRGNPSTPPQVRYEGRAWNASYGGRNVWSYILEPEMPKGPVPLFPLEEMEKRTLVYHAASHHTFRRSHSFRTRRKVLVIRTPPPPPFLTSLNHLIPHDRMQTKTRMRTEEE
ncbi:hypothetical protein TNCV_815871 [Trichonephila clavipes]|nr:hypothetical protein TNCV_815871 [Trichonephila clavipes]